MLDLEDWGNVEMRYVENEGKYRETKNPG